MTVGTGCTWTAVSNDSWITISAGTAGTGNGTVSYSVAANTGTTSRTGTMTIGGQTFTVLGVVRDEMQVNAFADLWVPISTDPSSNYRTQQWGDYWAMILARSKADIPAIQA